VKRAFPLVLALAASLVLAAPAAAESKTQTYTVGPITVGPYQVKQALEFGIPKPAEDAYITGMDVDIVDRPGGAQVPINRLMLHHVVFANTGRTFGDRRDGTCASFTSLDSVSKLPGLAERFYAAGEERARLALPEGYAYPTSSGDNWLITWMLMNHRSQTDTAYIEYHVTYDTEPKTAVKPYWLDIKNCLSDPVFDAPGGGKRGSTYRRSVNWNVPESGRLVAGGGHVHGGAKNLVLSRPACGDKGHVYTSRPLWGNRDHPFYNVRPILHEPGPVNMSGFTSADGFRVSRGETLRMDANYDGELVHTRVMGIMLVYLVPDESVTETCAPPPADLAEYASTAPGRTKTPRFKVPLTGIGPGGQARTIQKPPGKRKRVKSGTTIQVTSEFFSKPNVTLRAGGSLRWLFQGPQLHNVTVANGPRGFSSVNLNGERDFRKKLKVPGTYQLFCGLHPVTMTSTVKVVRQKHRRRNK
jgi:plastocyanin